MRYITIIAFNY